MVVRVGYLFRTSIGRIKNVTGRARAVREDRLVSSILKDWREGRLLGVQQENIRLV